MVVITAMKSQPEPPDIDPDVDGVDPFSRRDLPPEQDGTGRELLPHAVRLDARTGRLVCPRLGLEAEEMIARITQKRLMRVFGRGVWDGQDEEEDGGALCASENRRVADHGRPGRECAGCEDRSVCTPRWRIVWEEPGSRLAFVHTLSATGTTQFTRYALALGREGLRPQEVLTRLSVEELRRPGAEARCRRLRFEKVGLRLSCLS